MSDANNPYQLEVTKENFTLKIRGKKKPWYSLYFLLVLAIVPFVLPILAFVFVIVGSGEFGFGFIIVLLLMWLPASFFLKLYLWNKYGEEVYVVNRRTLEFYNDYKYFKDNHKCMLYSKIDIYTLGELNSQICFVVDNKEEFATHRHFNLSKKDLNSMLRFLGN